MVGGWGQKGLCAHPRVTARCGHSSGLACRQGVGGHDPVGQGLTRTPDTSEKPPSLGH